jgi:hypothetical protein
MNDTSETMPQVPLFLGWAGVIPFGIAAIGAHSGISALVLYGLLGGTTYAAIILSFLGAIHWGLAMHDDRHPAWYVWSITPALLAWATLLVFDVELRLLGLIPLHGLAWSVDRQAFLKGLIPAWYMRLRHGLTAGAVICLSAMLLA